MATPLPAHFGALLKRLRRAAGLTQEQLAARAGYSAAYVSMLERGARLPSRDTATQLAEALALGDAERARLLAALTTLAAPGAALLPAPVGAPPALVGVAAATPAEFIAWTRPPLVGRQRELRTIARHLAPGLPESQLESLPDDQAPPLLLLAGEPGIGKSRLLHEAAALARAQGWTVLEGGCHRRAAQEPYAPLLGALQRHLRPQPPAALRRNLQGCAWLVRLLPELADDLVVPAPRWNLPPEQESRLMFAAVARYLANIVGPAGTLLILDDLQWARADALDLLAALVGAAAESPLRVVAAYRSTDIRSGDPLAALRTELVGTGVALNLDLAPLAAREAAELLDLLLERNHATGAGAVAGQVLPRAGGNPFFLVSYARALGAGALDSTAEVPQDVAEATRQRVAALPATAQELLGAAALIGRRSPRSLLFAVAMRLGQKTRQAVSAVEAACQARLLIEEGNDAYLFAHDLIREVIVRDISTARRATLHNWIAETLERAHGHATPFPDDALPRLAFHFRHADRPERAALYLERAGDQAHAMCAYGEAQRYYQDLVTQLEALNRPLEAARARAKLGAALRSAARYDDAIGALQQSLEAYTHAGDADSAGRVLAQLGGVQAARGTPEDGIAQLRAFLDRFATAALQPAIQATILLALVQLCRIGGRYTDMLTTAESAATQADAACDAGLRARAEQDRATALLMLGRNDEGARVLEAALPGLETLDDPSALARALNNLSVVRESRGDFAQARHHLARAVACAERSADPTLIAFMVTRRATNALARGEWDVARADYERAVATMRQVGQSWANPYPLMGIGRLELVTGHRDAATAYLAEAAAIADRVGDVQARQNAQAILAEADLIAGDARAVVARLADLFARTEQQSDAAVLLPPLIWAYDALGEAERADALLERALDVGNTPDGRLGMINVRRVQAQVAARRGHWDEAEAACVASLTLARQMTLPYGEVQALAVLGNIAAATGAPDRARAAWDSALALCARLGERLYAEAIERLLVRLPAAR